MKLKPIEYIGPAPTVKKPRNPGGGWLLIGFAAVLTFFLARPFVQLVQAQQSQPNATTLEAAGNQLDKIGTFGAKLAKAALARTEADVVYDLTYRVIDFPNGDIPANRGKAEGRHCAFLPGGRHRSPAAHQRRYVGSFFASIRGIGDSASPIPMWIIAGRLICSASFVRNGESLERSNSDDDYEFGDVVVWLLPGDRPQRSSHIGIVVPGPGKLSDEKWVVHNNGSGPTWENELFSYHVIGHYRFAPESLLVDVEDEALAPL